MQADMTHDTNEATHQLVSNRQQMLSLIRGKAPSSPTAGTQPEFTLSLERIVIDHAANQPVPYDGEVGIEALLRTMLGLVDDGRAAYFDGRLMGFDGHRTVEGHSFDLHVSLDAGGQLICTVGPAATASALLAALLDFDRMLHVASKQMGCDYELMAEGYNPFVASPLDVQLVPRTRWTLLNAFLAQTGRYARDAMRCSCSTVVGIGHAGEPLDIARLRYATALSPLLTFLTDNVRSFRGVGARRSPRMVRTVIWNEVDPARCGIVPGTFDNTFTLADYERWVEGIQPIMLTDEAGSTYSTGKQTTSDIMGSRALNERELAEILQVVYPYARMSAAGLEILQTDALRPRMAAGYAAFVMGLLSSPHGLDALKTMLGRVTEDDVRMASHELRLRGWDAQVYGHRAADLADKLVDTARAALDDAFDKRLLDEFSELWMVRMVPRDAFVHQETKAARGW